MNRLQLSLFALAALPAFCDPPRPVVTNAVTDVYHPFAFDQQRISGLFGARMRANIEGYMEHMDVNALIAPLQQPGQENGDAAGTFLDAGSNAYEYSRDPQLKPLLDRAAKSLLAIQGPNGYLGNGSAGPPAAGAILATQASCLRGLLAYYRISGDTAYLAGARKLGDALVSALAAAPEVGGTDRGAAMRPLIVLYRYTGDVKYLNICKSIATEWIEKNANSDSTTSAGLSTLSSLVELYRTTGNESYLSPAVSAWTALKTSNLNLAGGVTTRQNPDSSPEGVCASVNWIDLSALLLQATGKAEYVLPLEQSLYNQLLAAQNLQTGAVASEVPLNGAKKTTLAARGCSIEEVRGLSMIPRLLWGTYGNGIVLLSYSAGRAAIRLGHHTLQLYTEATYPATGDVLLHIEPDRGLQNPMEMPLRPMEVPLHKVDPHLVGFRFPLRLRVPEWTSSFVVEVAGTHLTGKPGEFLVINRPWKPGDTVKISINMTTRVVDGGTANPGRIAIERGPQVLALGKTLNPDINLDGVALRVSSATMELNPAENQLPGNWIGEQAYAVPGEYEGKPHSFLLAPFADVFNYRVWIKKSAQTDAAVH